MPRFGAITKTEMVSFSPSLPFSFYLFISRQVFIVRFYYFIMPSTSHFMCYASDLVSFSNVLIIFCFCCALHSKLIFNLSTDFLPYANAIFEPLIYSTISFRCLSLLLFLLQRFNSIASARQHAQLFFLLLPFGNDDKNMSHRYAFFL